MQLRPETNLGCRATGVTSIQGVCSRAPESIMCLRRACISVGRVPIPTKGNRQGPTLGMCQLGQGSPNLSWRNWDHDPCLSVFGILSSDSRGLQSVRGSAMAGISVCSRSRLPLRASKDFPSMLIFRAVDIYVSWLSRASGLLNQPVYFRRSEHAPPKSYITDPRQDCPRSFPNMNIRDARHSNKHRTSPQMCVRRRPRGVRDLRQARDGQLL